jgi:Protein of unknown function/AsmA-like C-terminal region
MVRASRGKRPAADSPVGGAIFFTDATKNGSGNVKRRVRKFTLLAIFSICGFIALFAAAFMLRLSQGPVTLTFLKGPIETAINSNLAGYRVDLENAVIERDRDSGQPRVRLRNVVLQNPAGDTIARAPRAAIGIDGAALFAGRLVPRQLELIGPRIELYRDLNGKLSLGFGKVRSADAQTQPQGELASESDAEPIDDATPALQLRDFLEKELLSGGRGATAVSTLETVKVSNATLVLFDEFNQANWNAPSANLVFRRMPYGFALFADITIATGKEPWRSEFVANYRSASRSFALSARIFDLVPADLSDKVFALHRLAQVRFPLSGKAEFEFTDEGVITRATAELTASRGIVGFPGYIADPIAIEEGLLRFDLDPVSGTVLISDSTLGLGGTQTQLEGKIVPQRLDDGRLSALDISLMAKNLSMASSGQKGGLQFERVELQGLASVVESRFDIQDLVLQTGNAGLRVRGSFEGGEEAIGIRLSGVMRNLPVSVVQKLWPPIIAPNTRKWLNANVSKGLVPEGQFQINVPGEAIARAFEGTPIADNMVDLRFSLRDVETRYFAQLPPISGASGSGRLQGNRFEVMLENGTVKLGSGGAMHFISGKLEAPTLNAKVVPVTIHVEAKGNAEHLLELLDYDPLNYASAAGLEPNRIGGAADVGIDVALRFQKTKRPVIEMRAQAGVADIRLKGVFEQADIDGGAMTFTYGGGMISAKGTVQLNRVSTFLQWSRAVGKNVPSQETVALEAELDDQERAKLGLDMGGFVRGPVRIKLKADQPRGKLARAKVEAVLTKAELRVDAMRWWRPPGIESHASFDVDFTDPGRRRIQNIKIDGGNISVRGEVVLGPQGELLSADFPKIELDDENRFRMKLRRKDGAAMASVTGEAFDARQLINGMFKPDGAVTALPQAEPVPVTIQAKIGRVYANRGEVITDVEGRLTVLGNMVQDADIQGTFLSGAPVTYKITPADGYRDMRVTIRDAGAGLRAANIYSKASGGQLELTAQLGVGRDASVKRGLLTIRNFEIRDETTLSEIERQDHAVRTKPSGPRNQGLAFTKLTMPFSSDQDYVRIGDSLIKGPELGASVQGIIRKRDGALDIGGTIIPAYELNSALSGVPLLGDILTGGKGQGVFGVNFALRGTMQQPRFVVNPVSALTPGIFRRIFDMGGNYSEQPPKKQRVGPSN